MAKPGSLREVMPTVAAWIDEFREAFGREYVDRTIASSIGGAPGFCAEENGITVGTPIQFDPERSVKVADMWLAIDEIEGNVKKARR